MPVRVAINGFGRIGRNVLRGIIESGRTDIEVVAINEMDDICMASPAIADGALYFRTQHYLIALADKKE